MQNARTGSSVPDAKAMPMAACPTRYMVTRSDDLEDEVQREDPEQGDVRRGARADRRLESDPKFRTARGLEQEQEPERRRVGEVPRSEFPRAVREIRQQDGEQRGRGDGGRGEVRIVAAEPERPQERGREEEDAHALHVDERERPDEGRELQEILEEVRGDVDRAEDAVKLPPRGKRVRLQDMV